MKVREKRLIQPYIWLEKYAINSANKNVMQMVERALSLIKKSAKGMKSCPLCGQEVSCRR